MIGVREPGFDAAAFGKVAVVMGGWSPEREVSLMSGEQVLEGLVSAGIDAHALDAERDVATRLVRGDFDRAFLILHGGAGEDGTVQAALDLAGVPYTGSGVLGCALSMDKQRSKEMVAAHGIPVARGRCVTTLDEAIAVLEDLGPPLVVKPVAEGSSIGVSMIDPLGMDRAAEPDLAAAFTSAFSKARRYGAVLIEERLPGPEITAAIVGDRSLPLVSMFPQAGFYDYHAKYIAEDTRYECPAKIPAESARRTTDAARTAFDALGCHGWGRVDFILDAHGVPRFIECNTAPGMTSHSLVPMAAHAEGIDFQTICIEILATTLGTPGDAA